MATVEGAYRCAECKSWRHLLAWAAALIEGPLGADGNLTEYQYVEDCYLHEDSIHCTKHANAPIEMFHKGRWCRYWSCPKCQGRGRVAPDGRPSAESAVMNARKASRSQRIAGAAGCTEDGSRLLSSQHWRHRESPHEARTERT